MFLMHVYLNYVNVVFNKKVNVDFQVFGLNICFIYDYVLYIFALAYFYKPKISLELDTKLHLRNTLSMQFT